MMNKIYTERKVCTIAEAAQQLGMCKNTIRKLLADGRIQSIRVSDRKILIPCEAVESFLRGEK